MFFRNLTFFTIPAPTARAIAIGTGADCDEQPLDGMLAEFRAGPCGLLELQRRGWAPPLGAESTSLHHRVGACVWLSLEVESKLLPAAAINAELAKRLVAIEKQHGRRLGGKARKQLKDDVVHELLPKALVKTSRINGYVDTDRGVVVVDTASRRAAETFVSELRAALGTFPAVPVNAETSTRAVLTHLLARDSWEFTQDSPFLRGDACVLKDPVDGGELVSVSRSGDLGTAEVQEHLRSGKQCTRLALATERLSFVYGEDLVVRRLKLDDVVLDSLANTERDNLQAELDARFALLTAEVGHLFDALVKVFTLTRQPAAGGAA